MSLWGPRIVAYGTILVMVGALCFAYGSILVMLAMLFVVFNAEARNIQIDCNI